jgi:hypothetical protein
MIRFYRNVIEAARIIVPAEPWFGSALHRDAAPAFSLHRLAFLGIYVVVVARLAWQGGRPRIALATRQLIRAQIFFGVHHAPTAS